MTDSEIEVRARRAYEIEKRAYCEQTRQEFIQWESLNSAMRAEWIAIARAVLEDPSADPFEEWYEHRTCGPREIDLACAAWNAATARERELCAQEALQACRESGMNLKGAEIVANRVRWRPLHVCWRGAR